MEQSRLVKYIGALSSRDKEQFRRFVESPYFNQHEKTIHLLQIILSFLERSGRTLSREKVFKKLFPGEAYEEQRLHDLMSNLKKLFQRFLAVQHLENNPFREELFTLEKAFETHQFELLQSRGRQLDRSLGKHPFHDEHFNLIQYRLNSLLGYYDTNYVDRSHSANLQKMLNYLDRFYLTSKLRNCCHLQTNMMLMNTHFNFYFLEEILEHVRNNLDLYQDTPAIEIYYTILMSMLDENNPGHYNRLKEMMASRTDELSAETGRDLYHFSYNYCIRQINFGNSLYQRELFQLYRQGLKNDLLLDNGILNEWTYKNIVTLGCSLKEFGWTEKFIEGFREKLPNNQRENAYKYNLANLYYNKKMYHEAQSTLLHVQFTDVKYHLSSNFLLLRSYYALGDTEALLSLIETFRIYVMRNRKMTVDQKRGYTNFLRFARRLVSLKHQAYTYSRKELSDKLSALAKNIQETENVINRGWLLEECTEKELSY